MRKPEEDRRTYQAALDVERTGYEHRIAAAEANDDEASAERYRRRLREVDAEKERSLAESRDAGDAHLEAAE
ncbi:MAG: hypothetical protein QOG85_512 [Gaiellaceae bacterium]|nr:hypothetical protein [Gaiellaceae bacterium]